MDREKHKQLFIMMRDLYQNNRYKELVDKANKYLTFKCDREYEVRARYMKACSLKQLERYDEAINELEKLLIIDNDNIHVKLKLFHIYYFLNNYEKALELLPDLYNNPTVFNNQSLLIMELVMKKSLGMDLSFRKGTRCDYIKNQIADYSLENAINHIKTHMQENNNDDNKSSKFKRDIDIYYLFECVIKNLQTNKKVNIDDVLEIHFFAVPGIGYDKNNLANFIRVVVVPNTTDIISMYPVFSTALNNIEQLNCDYDKLFKRDKKIKSMSMIDRFNKRYNR